MNFSNQKVIEAQPANMVKVIHELPGRLRLSVDILINNRGMTSLLNEVLNKSTLFMGGNFNELTGRGLIYYNWKLHNRGEIIKELKLYINNFSKLAFINKNAKSGVKRLGIEPEDLPLAKQLFNTALGGLALVVLTWRRLGGKTTGLTNSPVLFGTAAGITIITGYPLFKSGFDSLAGKHKVSQDAVLSAVSMAMVLLRESIPGLSVVWLANVTSLIETLALRATASISGKGTNLLSNGLDENNLSHPLAVAAREHGEKMSKAALGLAAMAAAFTGSPGRGLAVLLASSPGAAGQALPSAMAAAAGQVSKKGIMASNSRPLVHMAEEKARHNLLLVIMHNLLGLALAATGRLSVVGAAAYNNSSSILVSLNSLRLLSNRN